MVLVFFLENNIIMHLLFKNEKTHIFWMKFHLETLNIKMVLDLIHVYQYHTPLKNSPKNSTHNLSFEVNMQFFQILW
jgi:hypothetical protein